MAESIKYMGWSKRYAAAKAREQARIEAGPVNEIRHAHSLKRGAKMDFDAGKLSKDDYEMFVLEQDERIAAAEKRMGAAPRVEAKPEPKVEEKPRKPKLELPKLDKSGAVEE